jgi:hypothetical protein
MGTAATRPRQNRTITVDCHDEATYFQLLDNGNAFVEWVIAFIFALGFQLRHKATCRGGGGLTRHSHYVRGQLGGVTIWRLQCTTCRVVFTVCPISSSAIVRCALIWPVMPCEPCMGALAWNSVPSSAISPPWPSIA